MASREAALRYLRSARGLLRRASTAVGTVVLTAGAGTAYVSHSARKLLSRFRTECLVSQKALKLPDEFVLELDLQNVQLVETEPNPFARLTRGGATPLEVRDVVKALEEAGKDERVAALLAVLPDGMGGVGGMAQVQEVRSAVSRFRLHSCERGAPCIAYADAYGGMASYYLSTAFQHVYMQPSGLVVATGLASQVPFVRGLLDKWKIVPISHKREEYKNAADPVVERGYSRSYREANSKLIQGLAEQMFEGIALSRGLSLRAVRNAVDKAPLTAAEAEKCGLLDGGLYRDEIHRKVTELPGRKTHAHLKRIPLKRYLASIKMKEKLAKGKLADAGKAAMEADVSGQGVVEDEEGKAREAKGAVGQWYSHWRQEGFGTWWEAVLMAWNGEREAWEFPVLPHTEQPGTVALVFAMGAINQGKQGGSRGGRESVHSVTLCKQLEALRKDTATKAVVLRVDSPGGSATASDSIHREVMKLREAGKVVVVSMGNVCASGGYFISCAADKIVAQPGTLTGSIGVIMLKLNAAGFFEDLGINIQTIKAGKNADLLSAANGYTSAQHKTVNHIIDGIYDDFVGKVAAGRGLSFSAARKLAKGRVYTGIDAKEAGLVDELGGLEDAMRIARQLSELPDDAEVKVVGKLSRAEAFRKLLGGDSAATAELAQGLVEAGCPIFMQSIAEAALGKATAQWAGQAQSGVPQTVSMPHDVHF